MTFFISTKPVIETFKQTLQGQNWLVEFYSKNTDWEHHLQCFFVNLQASSVSGSKIYHFIIRRGTMTFEKWINQLRRFL